jgi:hypothetical protein
VRRADDQVGLGDEVVGTDGVVVDQRAARRLDDADAFALDDGRRQADTGGDLRQHVTRQPARVFLHFAQDLHQRLPSCAVPLQHALDELGAGLGGGHG